MEVDWTYTEEGFLCHRKTRFQLEPQGQHRRGRLRRSWRRLIEEEVSIVAIITELTKEY
jgi:hypothetical protein